MCKSLFAKGAEATGRGDGQCGSPRGQRRSLAQLGATLNHASPATNKGASNTDRAAADEVKNLDGAPNFT